MRRFISSPVCMLLCGLLASACYLRHERSADSSSPNAVGAGRDGATRCTPVRTSASHVIPRVILVLDGSCSMSTNYPANGERSSSMCTENPNGRWAALRRALVDPQLGIVTKLQGLVQFGVVVFGTQPTCPIPSQPVLPALNNLSAITTQLPLAPPGQFTPTGPALDWVYENLIQPASADRPQIVILATDGEPNTCGVRGDAGVQPGMTDYQPSLDAVRKGTAKQVTTYVISLADATGTFHDHLQELANLGNPSAAGQAALYEPASPEQLAADLEGLLGVAIGCDIALSGSVDTRDACQGQVTVNDRAATCGDSNGWRLLDPRHVRLEGQACERFLRSTTKVDLLLPCAP
jgi:hypothetical protein